MVSTLQNEPAITTLRRQSERKVFITMGLSMAVCACLWCVWCILTGHAHAAVIPGIYIGLAGASLIAIRSARAELFFRHVLLIAGVLLPFVFQLILGGLDASGMVMLWSLPTLVAAVNLQSGGVRYGYLAATGILLTTFAAFDPVLMAPALLPEGTGHLLLAFNLATIMPANFILADHMLRAERTLRKRVFAQQRETNERFVQALEDRNMDMQQSLDYAARIQMALWPDRDRVRGLFEQMHVHYEPKEAVGGDFLWHARVEERSYFMVLDCTGHGVPGSLMSMLMHGLLNEVVHTGRNLGAAEVVRRTLQLLNDRLDRERTGNTDGAEMAVLCFDHGKRSVSCCSYGCGIIVQEGERTLHLKSHSGNAALMQGSRLDALCEHILTVSADTRLFLYTDGVADQFCANDRRKFTRARLEACIVGAASLAPEDQIESFQRTFAEWRGETPLLDDILLVGVVPAACWRSYTDLDLDQDLEGAA